MRSLKIVAGLALALLSAPAFAAGGVCIGCVEHEQAMKAGPADGYLTSLRDQYKPLIIVIDRSTSKPTVTMMMVMGGVCGGCGGRSEAHAGSTTNGGGLGGGVHNNTHIPDPGTGGITGRDVLGAIAAGFGGPSDLMGGAGGAIGGAVGGTPDGGRTADTTTGGATGLSGGERNANGDSLGIGN